MFLFRCIIYWRKSVAVGNLRQFNPDESEKTVDEWRDLVSEKRVPVSLVLSFGQQKKVQMP